MPRRRNPYTDLAVATAGPVYTPPIMEMPTFMKTQFDDRNALKLAVQDWLLTEHLSWHVDRNDKRRYTIDCLAGAACNFFLRGNPRNDGEYWIVTEYRPHTCPPTTHEAFGPASSAKRIASHHANLISSNTNLKPTVIQNEERERYGHIVSYRQAHRGKELKLQEDMGTEAEQVKQVPGLLAIMGGYTCYRTEATLADEMEEDPRFDAAWLDEIEDQRILDNMADNMQINIVFDATDETPTPAEPEAFACYFIAPKPCQLAAQHLRRFISLDGCHTSSPYGLTILTCVAFDANNQIIPLAWALVAKETKRSWRWFLKHLKKAYPQWLDTASIAVLSDRQKGLLKAVTSELRHGAHYFCIQHIKSNIIREFGASAGPQFIELAYEINEATFKRKLEKLATKRPALAIYIRGIDVKSYARWATLNPTRYGYFTSNISESINNAIKQARQEPYPLPIARDLALLVSGISRATSHCF